MKMRVGLNLLFLVPGETGGMEVYARELVKALATSGELELLAFINEEAREAGDDPFPGADRTVVVPVRSTRRVERVRAEQQLLPPLARRADVALVHSLASTGPAWGRFRRVVTIHDLIYLVVPEAHSGARGLGMRVLVPLAARRSQRVIVDSRNTADDVARHLGVGRHRIDVVPLGLGAAATATPLPEPQLRASLGVADGRPIVLNVSPKRPHKNLGRLVEALALIAPERRPVLVVPGYTTAYESELRAIAERTGVAADVRWLDWVDAETLEGLYAAAACFVYPSLYEGFGLPVLEAMARGVPVACSDRGALAEVAGDAALRVDAESPPAIAAAIERLLTDTVERGRLRAAGRIHAARFTWEATAAGTLASYRRSLSP